MLVQFAVENYLSYDDKTVFSMVADKDYTDHTNHVRPDRRVNKSGVLKCAAIYGANAAGKSNLARAIGFAKRLILHSPRPEQRIDTDAFRLNQMTEKHPSRFEFIFLYDDILYSYGFLVDRARVHEEWLYGTGKGKERIYFERTTDATGGVIFEPGPPLRKAFCRFIAQATRPNQLFLSAAIEHNLDVVKPVHDWFRHVLTVVPASGRFRSPEMEMYAHADFERYAETFLRSVDTGVGRLSIEEHIHDIADFVPLKAEERAEFIEHVRSMPEHTAVEMRDEATGDVRVFSRGSDGEPLCVTLAFHHSGRDDAEVRFTLPDESDGTRRLVELLPALFSFSSGLPLVVIIDEIERSLHPLLVQRYVRSALETMGTSTEQQLIFTTHDENLLDLEMLRRDEVWFAEKNRAGATRLHSLAEFRPRKDLRLSKGYLDGRFGGIPLIQDGAGQSEGRGE